jgi:hypothetical protein
MVRLRPIVPPHMLAAPAAQPPPPAPLLFPNQTLPNVAEVILPSLRIQQFATARMEVISLGDVPQVLRFLIPAGGQTVVWAPGAAPGMPPQFMNAMPALALAQLLRGPRAYLQSMAARLAELDRSKDPLAEARRHFFELDRETHPMLAPSYLRGQGASSREVLARRVTTLWLTQYLAGRCRERACRHAQGDSLALGDPSPDRRRQLRLVADLFRRLIWARFRDDLERYQDAFEHFANGDLRFALDDGQVTTEPSSGWFFLFAELAMVIAHDAARRPERDFWEHIANVAVRCQKIYCRVYGPANPARATFGSYRAAQYHEARRLLPRDFDALARAYRGCTVTELARRAAANACELMPGLIP